MAECLGKRRDDFGAGTLMEFLQTVEKTEPESHQTLDLPVALDQCGVREECVGQTGDGIGGVRLEGIAVRAEPVLGSKFSSHILVSMPHWRRKRQRVAIMSERIESSSKSRGG